MTREEYEEQRQRIEAEASVARKEFVEARSRYDQLCDELSELRHQWRDQQATIDQ
ncbi:hypothetical protein [Streptomyces californicus]